MEKTEINNKKTGTTSFSLRDMEPIIIEVINGDGEFRFFPRGISMLPLIREGKDSLTLVKVTDNIGKYDIPLFKRNDGNYVLHRIMKKDGKEFSMCGDNQTVFEKGIKREQMIGVVNAIYRNDTKRIDMSKNILYRIYVHLWCFMPLRKFVFFARRAYRKLKRIIKK